jgi:hypothetical protein
MTKTIDTATIQRGTNWLKPYAFSSGHYYVENWEPRGYVQEKREQAESDTRALLRMLDTFIATGDLAHLADYRGRLEVMIAEIDQGAWHAIVAEGAR